MMLSEAGHRAALEHADAAGIDVTFVARGWIRLLKPVNVVVVVGKRTVTVLVPAGFELDGASVPSIFWPVVSHPLSGSSLLAAIVHDFMCERRIGSSRLTHDVFRELLKRKDVAPVRCWAMYKAVLWFGSRWPDATPLVVM